MLPVLLSARFYRRREPESLHSRNPDKQSPISLGRELQDENKRKNHSPAAAQAGDDTSKDEDGERMGLGRN